MRYLIIALSALALTACSTQIKLNTLGGEMAGTGTLKFLPNPPHQLTVVLNGKTYEGKLDSEKVDNTTELRQRFGANSKRFQEIFMGLDTTYNVYLYSGTIQARDDTTIECQFLSSYRGKPLGECVNGEGQAYEFAR